jgi:hypothetical protein
MSSVNDNAPSPLPVDGVSKRKQGKCFVMTCPALSSWRRGFEDPLPHDRSFNHGVNLKMADR